MHFGKRCSKVPTDGCIKLRAITDGRFLAFFTTKAHTSSLERGRRRAISSISSLSFLFSIFFKMFLSL